MTVTPVTPTSQASRARGGVAEAEAGGEGVAAEAAGHRQLRRGPGAERGTILVLSTDLISPPAPGAARRVIATFNFSLQIPV